jgi:hypothetical protein
MSSLLENHDINSFNNSNSLNNKFDLFMRTVADFGNYKKNPDEKERLFAFPENTRLVLREILSSNKFNEFMIENEGKRYETKRKEKELRKKKKLEELDEDFKSNEKLVKVKRAQNSSCFGQRTVNTLCHFYNSINEMIAVKDQVIEDILFIDKEAFFEYYKILIENRQNENNFIFMNPYKKNDNNVIIKKDKKKKKLGQNNILDLMTNKAFASIDDYYKLIENELENEKDSKEKSQYELLLKTLKDKRNYEKKNNLPLLTSPKNKKSLKKITVRNRIESNLPQIGFFSVINRNKDVKFSINSLLKRRGVIRKKDDLYLNDYDYNEILRINKK